MKAQPLSATFGQRPASWAWVVSMVKRRYATDVPPAVSGTVVGVTVPSGNCPVAATVQATLSVEVSTRNLPVLAVGSSPQVADGLITSSATATVAGSLTTTFWPA